MNISSILAAENAASTFFFVSAADLQEFAQTIVAEAISQQKALAERDQETRPLTTKETCEAFGISATTLWRWQGAGLITPVKVGGQNRFSPKDVERVLSGRV